MEKSNSCKRGQAKDLMPGMLVIIILGERYDYSIWGGQDLNDDAARAVYGRIWIEKHSIGLLVKNGLKCCAILTGENTVIVPKGWCKRL